MTTSTRDAAQKTGVKYNEKYCIGKWIKTELIEPNVYLPNKQRDFLLQQGVSIGDFLVYCVTKFDFKKFPFFHKISLVLQEVLHCYFQNPASLVLLNN